VEAAATFAKSPQYQRMHKIDPSIPSPQFMKISSLLTRRAASLLIQLRTGHVPLNKHLHQNRQAHCCHAHHTLDAKRLLITTSWYAQERRKLKQHLGQAGCSLLLNAKAFPHLFKFVHATHQLIITFGNVALPDKD
jgi:hypothetical protein